MAGMSEMPADDAPGIYTGAASCPHHGPSAAAAQLAWAGEPALVAPQLPITAFFSFTDHSRSNSRPVLENSERGPPATC